MNYENYSEDMLESISAYRRIVLLIFFIQNDINHFQFGIDFLKECIFLKYDNNRLKKKRY